MKVTNLVSYGLAHAVVDASCAAILFSFLSYSSFLYLVILYSLLAFALQPIFGLIIDKLKVPRFSAILGVALVGLAIIFSGFPQFAIVLAGLGNAIFHVGGGTISLNLTPKKATAPGIFVAPGALGLFVGTIIGKLGYFVKWEFILLIIFICIILFFTKIPKINYKQEKAKTNYFELILLLLLVSIVIRSFIGLVLVFPWKTQLVLAVILTLSVVLGKAFGGILADKFGFKKIAVISLILSAPLLAFSTNNVVLAILAIFLFNITMPITLVAISNILPGRPGFAFGLTCLALIIGTILVYFGAGAVASNFFIFVIIIISALSIYLALKLTK